MTAQAYPHTGDRRRIERRAQPSALVFPERRTGFDRRKAEATGFFRRYFEMLWAYRRNQRALLLVLANITVLNIADLLFTQRALARGAIEVNPIMAALFASDPMLAAVVKVGIGLLVVAVIWSLRRYRRMLELSIGVASGYGAVFAYHILFAGLVLS